jgi:hypothetical protein
VTVAALVSANIRPVLARNRFLSERRKAGEHKKNKNLKNESHARTPLVIVVVLVSADGDKTPNMGFWRIDLCSMRHRPQP